MILVLTVIINSLVNNVTMITVILSKKHRSKWKMNVLKGLNNNILNHQGRGLWSGMSCETLQSHQKYPQQFDPGYGVTRDCRSDDVVSSVGINRYGNYDRNTDMDKILYLLAGWDVEDCM